jgi:phosphoserine phosphatase
MAKKKLIPMAILYDFDGTLAPGNMQEHNFLPSLGMESAAFWARTKELATQQDADEILAYMRLMLDLAHQGRIRVRREDFRALGAKLECFPGVADWFGRINAYALDKGIRAEHYIISSGLREMIEGSAIAPAFARIYASGFMYDENGVAVWPALAINYTTKTQFLFRINKGTFDVFDNTVINKFVPKDERPVPFENMVYIGDGETDIPCFRLVKEEGGHSIAVYEKGKKGAREKVERLTSGGRVSRIAAADYREGSEIDLCVRAIVDGIEAASRIATKRE